MSAKNIDYDNLQNVDFEDLRKWTLAKLDAKDNINFFDTCESTYAMANVRPEFGAQSSVSTMPSADFIASPPTQKLNSKLPTIVPDTTASGSSKASSGGQVSIDDLSKSLEALALKFAHLSDPQGRLPSSHDTGLNQQFYASTAVFLAMLGMHVIYCPQIVIMVLSILMFLGELLWVLQIALEDWFLLL
jgi:hypothetical protein